MGATIFIPGLSITIVGLILVIVGTATTQWSYFEITTEGTLSFLGLDDVLFDGESIAEFEFGPFRFCSGDECDTYDDPGDDVYAVQAMTVLGILCGFGAVAICVLHLVLNRCDKNFRLLPIFASIVALVAGVFVGIGVALWAINIHGDTDSEDNALTKMVRTLVSTTDISYGYSFYLTIAGGVLLFVSAIVIFIGGRRK